MAGFLVGVAVTLAAVGVAFVRFALGVARRW